MSLRVDLPTIRERTLEILRDAICNLEFAPGERLIERVLCEQMGVSRTSIREALRHLESEGLVTNVSRKGPSVVEISAEEAKQIYQVRGAIEGLAGYLFAQRAREDLVEKLDACLVELREAAESKTLAKMLAANQRFYDIIFEGSGNFVAATVSKSLGAKISILRAQMTSHWDPTSINQSLKRMERIVDSIKAGDAEQTRLDVQDHANRSADGFLRLLREREQQRSGGQSENAVTTHGRGSGRD